MASNQTQLERPPIVVVMGHVDHGKTALLDYIRKTNVVAREAGGITQSIGAYEIVVPQMNTDAPVDKRGLDISVNQHTHQRQSAPFEGRKITFIDTPGHEAFSKMRARGARVGDLAILVVAAHEGVKPQTKEVIKLLKETKTPFVVAFTCVDKPSANVERAKQDLLQEEVLLEKLGGNVSWQEVSSKTGQGIHELLDLILLTAEVEGFTYDPHHYACGVIIEAKMDNRRGIMATAVVKDGTLRLGSAIATVSARGKIKILENFLHERVDELVPSSPALILGFETLPQVGEAFIAGETIDKEIEALQKDHVVSSVHGAQFDRERKSALRVILKADVGGSLEAFSEAVKKLSREGSDIVIVSEAVGEITDGDVKLAVSSQALLCGFNVKVAKAAQVLAKAQGVEIITDSIIYKLLEQLEKKLVTYGGPAITGTLDVLAVFSRKGPRQLIGGKVAKGLMKRGANVTILRNGEEVGTGRIANLQHNKQDTASVAEGKECGLMVDSAITIEKDDQLQCCQ